MSGGNTKAGGRGGVFSHKQVVENLQLVITELQNIFGAVDDLEMFAENIDVNTLNIDMNTDEIETLITSTNTLLTSINGRDFATETILSAIGVLVDSINTKVATEATLAASKAVLDTIQGLLTSIEGKDFATETTLSALKTKVDNLTFNINNDLKVSLDGETLTIDKTGLSTEAKQDSIIIELQSIKSFVESIDANTDLLEAKLDSVISLLTSLNSIDYATETTLSGIKAVTDQLTFISDSLKVTLAGELIDVDTPPARFVKDTFETDVELDTATPANNEPLPTNLYNQNGERATKTNPIQVERTGDIAVNTTVPVNTSSVLLKAANADRMQIIITNTSSRRMWISFVNPATTSNARFLDKDESWVITTWKGAIYGIWDSGAVSGNALIEELDN